MVVVAVRSSGRAVVMGGRVMGLETTTTLAMVELWVFSRRGRGCGGRSGGGGCGCGGSRGCG